MNPARLEEWAAAVRAHAAASGIRLADDVVRELASHLEDVFLERVAAGETEAAARDEAMAAVRRAPFAELASRRRAVTESNGRLAPPFATTGFFDGLAADLHYAVRVVRSAPFFAISLVGILALSIGAIAAVAGVVEAVLLRPLPYRAPDRLVSVSRVDAKGEVGHLSSADWLDYAERVSAFENVAVYANWTHNLSGDGEPLRIRSVITSGNFFEVLGHPAAYGRVYGALEDTADADRVVVLSEAFWVRRFGRDVSVLGRTITLNSRPATVIGIMPRQFQFPARDVDLWMPIGMGPELRADRASEWLEAVARLRAHALWSTAEEEARAVAAALAQTYPATNANEQVTVRPLLDSMVGDVRPALTMIAGAVLFVFLVSCLSVASLLLARASVRQHEVAVRLAVGANTWRIARQLVVESGVLTMLAAGTGVAVGSAMLKGVALLAAGRVPRIEGATLNGPVVVVTILASLLVVAVCGLSAMAALRQGTAAALSRGNVRVAPAQKLRSVLLTTQMAVSFVLVATAMLVAGSYVRLQQVPAGLDTANVVSMRVTLSRQMYPDNAAHLRFVDRVLQEVRQLPGVQAAGVINDLPFAGNQMSFAVATDSADVDRLPPRRATVRLATPGYFETLRISLLAGRHMTADDRDGREPIAVVNQRAAEMLFGGRAIDRRITIGDALEWRSIVGVVEDTRHAGYLQHEGPVVYLPYAQKPFAFVNWIGILVRAADVQNVTPLIRRRIAAVDDVQPIYDVMLLEDYLARAHAPFRLNSWLVGVMAALSLLLAVAGVVALTAHNAAARRQEFGIRLALGATRAGVGRLIVTGAAKVVLPGMLLGALAAFFVTRLLSTLLFEMSPTDPRVFAAVGLTLGLAVFVASLPAAVRTARVDPASSIRAE